jgi:hypothetical protein
MTSNSDALLDETLKCLWAHCHPEWGDRTPLDVFNRLLAKNIRPTGWTSNTHLDLQAYQIVSRREQWSTDDLAKLRRGHARTSGEDFGCPIVIAEYEGTRLLDGTTRINRWVERRDSRPCIVNIHTVARRCQFIELPDA